MAMNIKDREVHELARDGRTGDGRREGLDAISRHCSALPGRDARTADEIVGYDDRGRPRRSRSIPAPSSPR
jgi:hypothetical protein